ncbi:MAG: hypothetical protein AAGE80_02860 [Pseudomonadota bacterium]
MSEELHLVEVGTLRGELNSVIDRMNGNENFSAGTVSAIFAFVLSTEISVISLVLSFLSLIIIFIGLRRYTELRAHSRKLDEYLQGIEKGLSPGGGWTVHYYDTIKGSSSGGYSTTRYIFWIALGAVCLLGTVYVGHSLFDGTQTSSSQ